MIIHDSQVTGMAPRSWANLRQRVGTPGAWTSGVFLAIALIAIAPVVLFAIVTVQLSSNAVREQVDSQIKASASASASVVEQQVEHLADFVYASSVEPGFQEAFEERDLDSTRAVLTALTENGEDVQLAFVVDAAGLLVDVLPETPELVGEDFSFRDWYTGASEVSGEAYVSEAYETAASGTPLVYVAAAPITSPTDPNEVIGYVAAGQTLEAMQGFVDEFADSQGVALTITDQAGTIVSAPGRAPTEIVDLDERSPESQVVHADDSVREVTHDGERWLSSSAAVEPFGWDVTAEVASDAALAELKRITTAVIFLAIVLSLMVLLGVAVLARQLRGRQNAVDLQARSEVFLKSIIDNIPSIITVKDAATLRVERMNPAGEAALGLTEGEMIGKTDVELAPSDSSRALMAEEREILESGRTKDIALDEIGTPSGVRQFRTRKIPIESDGDVPGFLLCISDDITDDVTALAALRAAKSEAERANTAKSDFLSRMSHELRTPLNAVIGFGQLLEVDDPTDEQRESIEQILRGGRHLLGLINEILDLARIETGRFSMSLEPIRMVTVAEEALNLVRPLAATNGIAVPEFLAGDWDHWVSADQQRVKQVLINLLANAIKYNEANGRVDISCEASERHLRINVTDTGPGISAERQAALFAPFERLGAETSGVEGTGLGLSLSKNLVEAMGGCIGVDSELGVGSTFWIELGLVEAPQVVGSRVRAAARSAVGFDSDGVTILYIEDNDSNILLVERLIAERTGVRLLTAKTGEEGAALAARHRPDLVLLDLNLPGVSGQGVIKHLRSRPETCNVPVIILSADATQTQIDKLLASGADHYLTKPIDVAQLMSTIDRELAAEAIG